MSSMLEGRIGEKKIGKKYRFGDKAEREVLTPD